MPDGPTPAREQLPLPRRKRQAHLEPHLRTPGTGESGTPFAAFTSDDAAEPARNTPADRDRSDRSDRSERSERADRAAAFHAGVRRGRGAGGPRRRGNGRRPTADPRLRPDS
jgi:hypothetical protein